MTGQLFVVPAATPADRHVHVVLALADGRELRFRDIRKFGRIGCWPVDPATGEVLDGGGRREPLRRPSARSRSTTPSRSRAFRARLRGRRGRLKPLLLDQGFIAGVGNIYADEALWRARLHPLRTAATLRPPDEARLHRELRAVLAEAVERRGSSIDDYTAPDGDGAMQERLEVYQRTGRAVPALRPADPPDRRRRQRATHFCSWCQRLPAADRPGAAAILAAGRAPRARGRRWVELPGEGTLGLTPDEAEPGRGAGPGRSGRAGPPRTRRARARAGRRGTGPGAPDACRSSASRTSPARSARS